MTLRLEPSLIAEIEALAEQLDMPYRTLTRGLIRRGLHQVKEAQRARQK
ncbi:MAG: hypothetical protein ACP5KN_08990 [Armatimonadota bacterium]